jgi:hypothetical protein
VETEANSGSRMAGRMVSKIGEGHGLCKTSQVTKAGYHRQFLAAVALFR